MRTTYVPKLSIFEDEELLPPRHFVQSPNRPVREVVDGVGVRLENTDMIADILCKLQQLRGGTNVRGNTYVRALQVDQTKQVCCQWRQVGVLGAIAIRLRQRWVSMCGQHVGRRLVNTRLT